ncbi:urokinase plasminogen activator surface receptor-like isoform X2 [Carassius carassius]|uniref:urokinase plasminogen activator surface receptor-like isoform X2 n=1 Tax=Carassius carassius TaxID=217509 RepID=UPI0028696F0B|nr:urokinase plasminogen activator surface receptor-like isoform X2 [Carassius carassius]
MDMQISAFLLFVLFTAGHSLSCYQCRNDTGSCADLGNITCPSGYSKCMNVTTVSQFGATKVNGRYCAGYCTSGSMNYGSVQVSYSCCDTDLCNVPDAPDPSTNTPNGKKCYYCAGLNCSNTVNCSGSEDHCISMAVNSNESQLLKGCVSKSICDYANIPFSSVHGISCCEGDLCNDFYNVTQNINITQNIIQNNIQNIIQNIIQNVIQNFTQNIIQSVTQSVTQNVTQNVTQGITQSVTQKVPQSTNSAKSITQGFMLLLIVNIIK